MDVFQGMRGAGVHEGEQDTELLSRAYLSERGIIGERAVRVYSIHGDIVYAFCSAYNVRYDNGLP